MNIQQVTDAAFSKYGRVFPGYDLTDLSREMKNTPLPADVVYVPSVEELENLPIATQLQEQAFGGMPIQVGYCNGHNKMLNAVEYHRDSEINIAITDLVVLVGWQQDITADFTYDTAQIEGFFVPAGTVFEFYATTLHYAPCCSGDEGFRCVVVLPKGTNEELAFTPSKEGESKLLTHTNKWLIAHPEAEVPGAFNGLTGVNISLL